MIDVSSHKNVENVIRYFLIYLPPRGVNRILDVGGGCNAPYRGVLQTRCNEYVNLDIRPGDKVDIVADIIDGTDFEDNHFDWSWCSETLEHIPQEHMKTFVDEVCRVSKNVVWTFPLPGSFAFSDDPGHSEVIVDMQSYEKDYKVFDKTTATGKGIWIFADKDRDIEITRKGIQQSGWSADDLPFYVKNYICYDRKTDKRWNFDKIREHKFWESK